MSGGSPRCVIISTLVSSPACYDNGTVFFPVFFFRTGIREIGRRAGRRQKGPHQKSQRHRQGGGQGRHRGQSREARWGPRPAGQGPARVGIFWLADPQITCHTYEFDTFLKLHLPQRLSFSYSWITCVSSVEAWHAGYFPFPFCVAIRLVSLSNKTQTYIIVLDVATR